MDTRNIVRRIISPIPIISVSTLLLFTLTFLIIKSLSEDNTGELQLWITIIGSIGIFILTFFLITNCYRLFRQYKRNEIGSKLTSKLVVIFLFLTVIPFSLIYFFSIQFLSKGVDNWFDVRVEQTVKDSILLSKTALDAITEEITEDTKGYANTLSRMPDTRRISLLRALHEIRKREGYDELSLYTDGDRHLLAFSLADKTATLPSALPDALTTGVLTKTSSSGQLAEVSARQPYTFIEPISESTQQFRVIVPLVIGRDIAGYNVLHLQAIKTLPLRYATLASSIEKANSQYSQMEFARGPLKFSLIVTLSLISLASLLFSILTAVYLSRRLVAPISQLASGTQKIAEGDYGTVLNVSTTDELGILTHSFNNMSQKINEAQQTALLSQQETEQQKGYLEAVLTSLSSGVFSFDKDKQLQICNSAAADILSLELPSTFGKTVLELAEENQQAKQFFKAINAGIESGEPNWQDEITLLGEHGRQMLIVRGTLLHLAVDVGNEDDDNESPESHHFIDNYVVVFDDVTGLIQAQRDAAWGEVARRLAHEIKNPLTPIQLSAERIQHKLSSHLQPELQETLERSTRTIVQQVEAMKEMVNAFSSYAQPVRAKLAPLNINQLIRDVTELHRSTFTNIELSLELDQDLPEIKANSSALRQVLNNLIINASHAMEDTEQGKLRISSHIAAKVKGQYIDIVIEDNGEGIPLDIQDSLFDPYVSSKSKGSGLGLAIVKRIVEEHSGTVWAHKSEFDGAAMHLRLPINAMQTYRGNRKQNTLHSESE